MGTANVKGLCNSAKRSLSINNFVKSQLPFIIFTETNIKDNLKRQEIVKEIQKKHKLQAFASLDGVLVLIRDEFEVIEVDQANRWVSIKVRTQEYGEVRIIGIYVPANEKERNTFLPQLESIPDMPNVKTMIGGDFNFVECEEDRTSKFNPKSANLWQLSTAHLNLVEIPPLHHNFTYLATHSPYMARLDRFYLSDNWDTHNFFTEVAKTRINSTDDHFQVVLKRKDEEKNQLYWKMNAFLLEEPYTKLLTEELIQGYIQKMNAGNIEVQYLKMKADLKALFIRQANFRVSRKKKQLIRLEQNILRARLLSIKPTELEALRVKVQDEITCNDQLCSRVKWLLEGEKCTKYFSGILKDRKKTYDMKSIEESEMTNYWKGVFSERNTTNEIEDKYFPRISQSVSETCEKEFALKEIKVAISGGLTSPGHDGFVSPLFKLSKMPEILQLLFNSWMASL
jgi:hypothetical protein